MNNFPNKKIKKKQIIENSPEELSKFDILPMTLEKLVVNMNDEALIVIKADNKEIAIPLNDIESTILVFIQSNCLDQIHTNTIYQLYLSTLSELGIKIISGTIEAKNGDVFYGRLCLEDAKQRRYFCQCTAGDCIILAILTNAQKQILRGVLDQTEEFEINMEPDYFDD